MGSAAVPLLRFGQSPDSGKGALQARFDPLPDLEAIASEPRKDAELEPGQRFMNVW
jgi:hypothetical protein